MCADGYQFVSDKCKTVALSSGSVVIVAFSVAGAMMLAGVLMWLFKTFKKNAALCANAENLGNAKN